MILNDEGWMNEGWMDRWMRGWMDEGIDEEGWMQRGRMDRWIDGRGWVIMDDNGMKMIIDHEGMDGLVDGRQKLGYK